VQTIIEENSTRSAQFMRKPSLRSPPVAKNCGLRYLKQLSGLSDLKTSEKAGFNDHGLARVHTGELGQSGIERKQVIATRTCVLG
jgi:hypothetical protein